ncbi:MAG TPA: branched-chain amino acid ABC transporter substrate-binding protein [Gemmata sp.]|nr:branched-chain amino acid ABC transporter substrate-binding protein [Gemmata sp.]
MDRRTFLAAGAAMLATPALAQDKKVIKIASSLPRTGSAQGQTDAIVNGIKMAIADYEGKVAGFTIIHMDMDDATARQGQWDAGKEADNARAAVEDKDVMAYIGPYNSGAAKVSMPILNEAGLVQMSPSATWPGLTKKVKGNENSREPDIYRVSGKVSFCRVCPHDFVQGSQAAVFVANELKAKSVFILDDKELYGAGIAKLFKEKCETIKLKVLGYEHIDPRQANFKKLMATVKGKKPDAVFFGGTSQSGGPQLARDMKSEGLNCPLVVPDGCYEEAFIKAAGAETFKTLTCYATIGGHDPSLLGGRGVAFVKKYKETYRKEPEAYAIYGYEAAKVVLESIKKVGKKDRDAIRKAVLATKDFDKGALPKWSFDADGDTTLQVITVSKIEDGKFKPLTTLSGHEQ